jgi:hypothetical protein
VVAGETYSFLAAHAGKFVYKNETVSFDWEWDRTGKHRNVDPGSVVAWNAEGKQIIRGNRAFKEWRTANTMLPGRDD